jgi:hypothetical protein
MKRRKDTLIEDGQRRREMKSRKDKSIEKRDYLPNQSKVDQVT